MPAEEGIRLHKEKRLFPVIDGSHEYDQEDPIGSGTRWSLDLTAEDDKLLAQQGVLGNKVCPGAGQIGECLFPRRGSGLLVSSAAIYAAGLD